MASTLTSKTYMLELDPVTSGQRMREIRQQRHLTREKLASLFEECGYSVSVNTIRAWEAGQKTPSLLNGVRLAGLLCCRLSDVAVSYRQAECGLGKPFLWDETFSFTGIDLAKTGRKLRVLRLTRGDGMTLDELSSVFDACSFSASPAAISSWERGTKKPTLHHLVFLAEHYGCPLDELVVRCDRSRESNEHDQQVPLFFIFPIAQRVHASACALFLIPVVKDLYSPIPYTMLVSKRKPGQYGQNNKTYDRREYHEKHQNTAQRQRQDRHPLRERHRPLLP